MRKKKIEQKFREISRLVENGDIVIFDPNADTPTLYYKDRLTVCINGDSIQISIRKDEEE